MKNLINYLNKNGYNFKICNYGSNYFYNVQALTIEAVIISIGFDNEQATLYNKLQRYLNRYHYTKITDGINPEGYHIALTTYNNYVIYETYAAYEKASQNECNELAHRYYNEPLTIDLNEEQRKIMNTYGEQLNAIIQKTNIA